MDASKARKIDSMSIFNEEPQYQLRTRRSTETVSWNAA